MIAILMKYEFSFTRTHLTHRAQRLEELRLHPPLSRIRAIPPEAAYAGAAESSRPPRGHTSRRGSLTASLELHHGFTPLQRRATLGAASPQAHASGQMPPVRALTAKSRAPPPANLSTLHAHAHAVDEAPATGTLRASSCGTRGRADARHHGAWPRARCLTCVCASQCASPQAK